MSCTLFSAGWSLSVCFADVEFGRLQARDLLQHLWTGPISNAPVNIVQGSKSVEVRPVGISKVTPLLPCLASRDCSVLLCHHICVMFLMSLPS